MFKSVYFKVVVVILVSLLFFLPSYAEEGDFGVLEVAPDLYMITGIPGGNVAFLVTGEKVIVVDATPMPDMAKKVVEKIKEKTDKPIKTVIFTHYHFDHTQGIAGYPESVEIIAHENVAKNIEQYNKVRLKKTIEVDFPAYVEKLKKKITQMKANNDPALAKTEAQLKKEMKDFESLKAVKLRLPTVTFDKEMKIKVGGQVVVHLIYPGPTHTNGNCMVYFPQKKTIHMGDMLFHDAFPYIDSKAGSDTANWAKQLEKTQQMDIEKVIPGHGDLTDKTGLQKMANYLTDLRKEVADAIAKGSTLEEMKKTILMPDYRSFKWEGYRGIGIEAVYNEMKKSK